MDLSPLKNTLDSSIDRHYRPKFDLINFTLCFAETVDISEFEETDYVSIGENENALKDGKVSQDAEKTASSTKVGEDCILPYQIEIQLLNESLTY
jgi:hypothetical protein